MYLTKLLLQNFRSYSQQAFDFDHNLNLILGPNGSGKTNILESIFFLSSVKSFRSSSQSHLISWNQPFASVRAKLVNNQKEELEIEIQLVKNRETETISRKFLLQKVEKTKKNFLGTLKTVVFHPEDIRLVAGSPSRRREFLDNIFSQTEWRYSSALFQFNKALKHRNELLDLIRIGKSSKNELFFWDQSLVKNDQIIHNFRSSFIKFVNNFFAAHPDPQINVLSLNYHPSFLTQEKIDRNYQFDLERGHTQAGVHRDDFSFDNSNFLSVNKNLAAWGSRGQQRLAVLSLRIAQIDYFENIYHDKPVLLLDDIFSELDTDHQNLVTKICHKYQTIVTSPDHQIVSLLPAAKITQLT